MRVYILPTISCFSWFVSWAVAVRSRLRVLYPFSFFLCIGLIISTSCTRPEGTGRVFLIWPRLARRMGCQTAERKRC